MRGISLRGEDEPLDVSPHPRAKYGRLTIPRWRLEYYTNRRVCRTLVDGIDVTYRVVEADDVAGRVELYCRDPLNHDWRVGPADCSREQALRFPAHVDLDGTKACRHVVYGDVEIRVEPRTD